MAYYPDLSLCEYVNAEPGSPCLAVGWLDAGHAFAQGDVSREFFERLCALLADPWTFAVFAGVQRCEFCRFSGGGIANFGSYQVSAVGSGLLFIPSGPTIYISPTNIAHYIDAHGYSPPEDFQRSVLECPEMRSMEYKKALLATPARQWVQKSQAPSLR